MANGKKLTCLDCASVNRVPADKLGAGPKCGTCGGKLMTSKVAELDPAALAKAKVNDQVPIVVDFWAPWCGPCRMMAPEFSKAAAKMVPEVRFAKINTEDYPKVSTKHGIRGIPLMIIFQNGKEVARQAGAMPAAQIEGFVRAKTGVNV
jgi:thioredoxin 2